MKCLIIDEMYPGLAELLNNIGLQSDYLPAITREEIISKIDGYEGLIVRSKTNIDKGILNKAANLRFIARAGAGIDNIDEVLCRERKITIFNAAEANRDAVGEHALGMLLAIFNKIHIGHQQVKHGIWDREGNRGHEISGKTVGIIGYGNMGRAFARRLTGFDCKIIAHDKFKTGFGTELVQEVGLERIYRESDILSLHIPLTKDTNRMVDQEFLENFLKPIVLINTARGKVLVLRDLNSALQSGKVTGAALDVLENEKLNELSVDEKIDLDNLRQRDNVLFTPHVAGWSHESYEKINHILVEKISAFLNELPVD